MKSIKEIELEAEKRLGVSIDAEGVNTRALEPSQIALLSIVPVGHEYAEKEGAAGQKMPRLVVASKAMYPLEYLLNALTVAKKSGARHVQLFLKTNGIICLRWRFGAISRKDNGDGKGMDTAKDFEALFYLAPRVDYHGDDTITDLPPFAVEEKTASGLLVEMADEAKELNEAVEAEAV